MAKRIVKLVLVLVTVLVMVVVGFFAVATATEYNPGPSQSVNVERASEEAHLRRVGPGDALTVMSFNIGYAGRGAAQDYFSDGGEMVRPDSAADVEANLKGILAAVNSTDADVYFLQEVDAGSKRSYGIDEVGALTGAAGVNSAFAANFKSLYTPYPWPPIGKVDSGLLSLSDLRVESASRVALPVPFQWPVRLFNLKRCLLVERVALGGNRELVLVNVHLDAYAADADRAAQASILKRLAAAEFEEGNYVIVGGDFNQTFPGVDYPVVDSTWRAGQMDTSLTADGWTLAHDPTTPTARLNNAPYTGNPARTQYFGTDGFLLSPNVRMDTVTTLDLGFESSDHNPVVLTATLLEPPAE
ncbi:MAG: hypothetical protein LBT54_07300 [Bifidobacteriaceae bacterium]|jgi:endonuclease/exonuclease/phosphatase family metal-dependent hydrolase|nr:hypothetical protein [Bifidobacteriaceae bacterium]